MFTVPYYYPGVYLLASSCAICNVPHINLTWVSVGEKKKESTATPGQSDDAPVGGGRTGDPFEEAEQEEVRPIHRTLHCTPCDTG